MNWAQNTPRGVPTAACQAPTKDHEAYMCHVSPTAHDVQAAQSAQTELRKHKAQGSLKLIARHQQKVKMANMSNVVGGSSVICMNWVQ
jgi:hypothetical protein